MKKGSSFNPPDEKHMGSPSWVDLVFFAVEKLNSEDHAKLVRIGKEASVKQCKYLGGNIPYGFSVDPKTRKYMVQEDEAENVRLVYAMIAGGASLDAALSYLKKVAAKTRSGNEFSRSSLLSMLKNDRYNGVYTYNTRRPVVTKIRIPGGMPRIVDEQVFNAVQTVLQRQT